MLVAVACSRAPAPVDATPSPPQVQAQPQPQPPADPTTFHGRTLAQPMGHGGADWLVRADRESTEQPERVIDALHLKPGMQVADVGAGVGYFTVRIARRLRALGADGGATGRVFATDIDPDMLSDLRANLADAGLANFTPILCTDRDARLPHDSLDLELLVDVYHELQHPAETLAQLRDALHPSGHLVLVEYRADDPSVGIKPEHTMRVAQVKEEVESAGFHLARVDEFLAAQRIFDFTR